MTAYTLESQMPAVELDPGAEIVFEAIDPSTGLPVAGVFVSGIVIYASPITAGPESQIVPPPFSYGTEAPGLTP